MTDSQKLIADYVQTGSEGAFRELVTRYLDLVYSAALRLVEGDTHRAQDVAQTVFVDLARQARTLSRDVMLGGWLHRHTCFVASKTMRGERRRQSRERQAVEMNALHDHSETDLTQIAPILDEAIDQLGEADRTAVLLRFLEQRDFRSIGEALGSNEDAARMRVTRALEKLHSLLKHRGVTTSAAALGVALSVNAVQAAPAGLAAAISTAAALVGTTIATTTTATVTKVLAMTTLQKTLIAAVVVASVATPLTIQHRAQIKLREENKSLRQQVDRLDELTAANKTLSNQLAQAMSAQSSANALSNEVQKLRDEVQALHMRSQKPAQKKNEQATGETNFPSVLSAPTVPLSPAESWANVGTATPKAALQTLYWAMAKHDTKTFTDTLGWEPSAEAKAEALLAAAPESVRQRFGSVDGVVYALFSGVLPINGFAVVSENIDGDDGTLVEQHQYADGRVRQNQVTMHHFDDGWRVMLGDEKLLRGFDAILKRAALTPPD